jgi:hypothetical protein
VRAGGEEVISVSAGFPSSTADAEADGWRLCPGVNAVDSAAYKKLLEFRGKIVKLCTSSIWMSSASRGVSSIAGMSDHAKSRRHTRPRLFGGPSCRPGPVTNAV